MKKLKDTEIVSYLNRNANRVMFLRKAYDSEQLMFAQVMIQLQILMKNKYAVSMFDSGDGIVVEYGSMDLSMEEPIPIWLGMDDLRTLYEVYKQDEDMMDELMNMDKPGNKNNNNNNQA